MRLEELYTSDRLKEMIRKVCSYENYDDVKSHLFSILCEEKYKNIIESKNDNEIFYLTSRILMNMTHSKESGFYREKNMGFSKGIYIERPNSIGKPYPSNRLPKCDPEMENNLNDIELDIEIKNNIVIKRINEILSEIPWYDAHLFRMYYLPYSDEGCVQKTYSFRQLEKMHSIGDYKITYQAIHLKVNIILSMVINKLLDESIITTSDIKNKTISNKKYNK